MRVRQVSQAVREQPEQSGHRATSESQAEQVVLVCRAMSERPDRLEKLAARVCKEQLAIRVTSVRLVVLAQQAVLDCRVTKETSDRLGMLVYRATKGSSE